MIALEINLESKEDCVFLRLSGQYDLPRLVQLITEVGKLCRETGCRRILADARGHVGEIAVMELHQIGELIAREIPRGSLVAVVVSEGRLTMDRFLETVAVNRGVPFHLFTDLESANLWLEGATSRPAAVSHRTSIGAGLQANTDLG